MIELVRIIAGTLSNLTTLNAAIASVALDGIDAAPPDVLAVLNEADHNLTFRESESPLAPCIVVATKSAFTGKTSRFNGVQDWEGDVIVGYINVGAIQQTNFRDAMYTMRAVKKLILDTLFTGNGQATARTRNNVALMWIPSMQYGITEQNAFGGVMTGALSLTCTTREINP
ncbi:MAG TPA: hypothetical protein VN602_07610 [Gemmatimonadaceae bacterium]|nr:hypothetical protein [Gemmatimonadaceae bacterium]